MDPVRTAQLRRHWPLLGAIAILLLFTVMHFVWFGLTLGRYRTAVRQASALGMSVDAADVAPMLPPRLFALISDNSMPAAAAAEQGASGALTASLLEDLSRRASASGLELSMSEPGTVTQQTTYVLVGAHLRMRGSYAAFVAFVDGLASGGRLLAVDRFNLVPSESGGVRIELWVSRCVVKRRGGTSG